MEYVEGQTLERVMATRRLDIREILRIAVQIADALDTAHSRGVVHRDIKPANIMITPRGDAKVLDFGLARVSTPAEPDDVTAAITATTPGTIVGTGPYMSPEQALGREVDHRSDIFSAGALFYEMATGKRAFSGSTLTETLMKVVQSAPIPVEKLAPEVPPELVAVITHCLDKDRDNRYQRTTDLLEDLRSLQSLHESNYRDKTGAPLRLSAHTALRRQYRRMHLRRRLVISALVVGAIAAAVAGWWFLASGFRYRSIAVLPFVNQANDPEFEYLSDGLTESVINTISQLHGLTVVSRSSTFGLKGKQMDVQEIARRLNVSAILTGSVMVREGMLRVSAELTDAASRRHLWGEQYTRPLTGAFIVQEDIAQEIAARLKSNLSGDERQQLRKRFTDSGEAYRLFLKGRYHWNKRTVEDLKTAIQFFQQAIDQDPTYALAYAGMADAYMLLSNAMPPGEAFGKSRAAANRALAIDKNLAEPYATLGYIALHYDWNWKEAETNLKRSSSLNANYPTARSLYARYLTILGRFPESVQEMARAQELDPLAQGIATGVGLSYYYARRYDDAITAFNKALEINPRFALALLDRGDAQVQKRQFAQAFASFDEALAISPKDAVGIGQRGHAYAVAGRRQEALASIAQLEKLAEERFVSPYAFALIYAGLRDANSALNWLEKGFNERVGHMVWLKVDPAFDPIRQESRFRALMSRMGLTGSA
jgi:serine/threonine-protein kinase